MFFQIKKYKDESFTDSFQLTDTLWLNCDAGWRVFNLKDSRVIVKGYIDSGYLSSSLVQAIADNPIPHLTGNFLALIVKNNTVTISHDIHRPTPLRINRQQNIIHNFNCNSSDNIWADRIVTCDEQFNISESFFDPYQTLNFDRLSLETVADRIDRILVKRYTEFFKHNTLPVKWFPSGGMDTTTAYVYLKKLGIPFETCLYEHLDYSKFICMHRDNVQAYWGYNQIHHWNDPCVLVTGGNGDENFLRGPAAANLLCLHYGTKLTDILESSDYHNIYYSLDKFKSIYKDQLELFELTSDRDRLFKQILNMNLHDHQHWHLENTLTFTPFKDIEITKLMLRLSPDDLFKQFKNAEINRMLIERNYPSAIAGVSTQKNINEKENIWKFTQ